MNDHYTSPSTFRILELGEGTSVGSRRTSPRLGCCWLMENGFSCLRPISGDPVRVIPPLQIRNQSVLGEFGAGHGNR